MTDRASLEAWVGAIVEQGAGRSDAGLFCSAWRAVSADDEAVFLDIAALAAAWRGTSELALESAGPGAAFLSTVRAAWPALAIAPWADRLEKAGIAPSYCVAVAVAASLAEIPLAASLTAYLHAFAANLVSAGVRLIPLGQTRRSAGDRCVGTPDRSGGRGSPGAGTGRPWQRRANGRSSLHAA